MKIRIETPDIGHGFGTRVFIDDVEQEDVTRVVFDHVVQHPAYLRIDRNGKMSDNGTHLLKETIEHGERQP